VHGADVFLCTTVFRNFTFGLKFCFKRNFSILLGQRHCNIVVVFNIFVYVVHVILLVIYG